MKRKPYILKTNEIETLLHGLSSHGEKETYDRMKVKAFKSMEISDNVDDMFMDMHEGILKQARSISDEDKESSDLKETFYTLASMLRTLAHEINRAYIKIGKNKDNERFLRLVHSK